MLLNIKFFEFCSKYNIKYTLLESGKEKEDYNFADLFLITPYAGVIVAQLLNIKYRKNISYFQKHYQIDVKQYINENEFDYEKRLISYKDNMFFPAFNINTGDKYIFAVNPDNELIYTTYYDRKLILCAKELFSKAFLTDNTISSISFNYDEKVGMDKYILLMLKEAFDKGAQDIDIQTLTSSVKIRFQINGGWTDWLSSISIIDKNSFLRALGSMAIPPKDYRSGVEMRYKVEADIQGNVTSWRVGIVPTILGENITIRRLPFVGRVMTLPELGFSQRMLDLFDDLMKKESGVCFITGSTGRGKSTTLYAVIQSYLNKGLKVNTVEDPIELIVPPAGQVQILNEAEMDDDKRMTYLRALKAFLRQKPDVIVVGETRTSEEAEAVVEAALTGHFTYTTLHTNSFKRTLSRLKTLNIDKAMVSDVLEATISQKLVRKLCQYCKIKGETYFRTNPKGCNQCDHLGYQGRIVIAEFARFDEESKAMLEIEKIDYDEIISYMTKKGLYISMPEDAREKIALGLVDERENGLC